MKSDVKNPDALELKKKIDVNNDLVRLTQQVKQNPADEVAKNQLNQTVEEATKLKIASPAMLTSLAQGQELIGQKAAAKENLKIVTAIDKSMGLIRASKWRGSEAMGRHAKPGEPPSKPTKPK